MFSRILSDSDDTPRNILAFILCCCVPSYSGARYSFGIAYTDNREYGRNPVLAFIWSLIDLRDMIADQRGRKLRF